MKSIGRTFGVSIRSLHAATQRDDFELGPIESANMIADIHTKAYAEAKASEWDGARQNAGVLSPSEAADLIGSPGLGWANRFENPGKYVSRKAGGDSEDYIEVPACATSVERDAADTLWSRKDGKNHQHRSRLRWNRIGDRRDCKSGYGPQRCIHL